MDTRQLGKPKSFDGSTDSWRQFKFTFLGYAGAVDSRLKQAMIESEVLPEAAITHSALPARDQRVSTQLYCTLGGFSAIVAGTCRRRRRVAELATARGRV